MKSAPEPHTRSGTSCWQRHSAYAEYPGMRLIEGGVLSPLIPIRLLATWLLGLIAQ